MWLSQMLQRMRSLATDVEADSREWQDGFHTQISVLSTPVTPCPLLPAPTNPNPQVLWSKQVEEVLDHCSGAESEQLLFQGICGSVTLAN